MRNKIRTALTWALGGALLLSVAYADDPSPATEPVPSAPTAETQPFELPAICR